MTRAMRHAAIALLSSSLAGCGGNQAVKYARGVVDVDPDAAYRSMSREIDAHPHDRNVVRIFVRSALRSGHDEEAVRALDRLEARGESDSVWVATFRDELWAEVFRPARDVLDTLSTATDADRRAAEVAVSRASLVAPQAAGNDAADAFFALEDGDRTRASELFEAAVTKTEQRPAGRPIVAAALRRAADVVAKQGDLERALEWGTAAVELAPEDVRASYDLGVHLHQFAEQTHDPSRFEAAIAQFERVLAALPKDVDARYNAALSAYRLGRLGSATAQLDTLMTADPFQAPAHRLAARLALAEGDSTRARVHVAAMRALGGTEVSVPRSALAISNAAGRTARRIFVVDGPPARMFRSDGDPANALEVWFYPASGRVVAFGSGRLIGDVRMRNGRDPGRLDPTGAAS